MVGQVGSTVDAAVGSMTVVKVCLKSLDHLDLESGLQYVMCFFKKMKEKVNVLFQSIISLLIVWVYFLLVSRTCFQSLNFFLVNIVV